MVQAARLPAGDVEHFKAAAEQVRYIVVAHLARSGLDLHGGFFAPTVGPRPLAAIAAAHGRASAQLRALLKSILVGPTDDLLPEHRAQLVAAGRHTQVFMSLAVEVQVVKPRADGCFVWEPARCAPYPDGAPAGVPPSLAGLCTMRPVLQGRVARDLGDMIVRGQPWNVYQIW